MEQDLSDQELRQIVKRKRQQIEDYQKERGKPRPLRDSLVGIARQRKRKKKDCTKNKRDLPEEKYLLISNQFIEAMSRQYLRPNESKVLWFLIRKTWGWRKNSDFIALKQFKRELGIGKNKISEALSTLRKRRIVAQLGNKTYAIQSDVTLWHDRPKKKRVKQGRGNS